MIGPQILNRAVQMVTSLLNQHQKEINQAYLEGEGGLTVNLVVKLTPGKTPNVQELEVGISFIQNRVKESLVAEVSEIQGALFDAVEKLRPKKGSGIDSVTIASSRTGKSVTLEAKE
jgi:hypothetical protein